MIIATNFSVVSSEDQKASLAKRVLKFPNPMNSCDFSVKSKREITIPYKNGKSVKTNRKKNHGSKKE